MLRGWCIRENLKDKAEAVKAGGGRTDGRSRTKPEIKRNTMRDRINYDRNGTRLKREIV